MNVVSLELRKELYELSRLTWLGEPSDCVLDSCPHHGYYDNGTFICPKYTLGYLIRKLPETIENRDHGYLWRWHLTPLGSGFNISFQNDAWVTSHRSWLKRRHFTDEEIDALTYWRLPLWDREAADVVARLLIELFKQGVLTRDAS